jgi:hypothetical protein
MERRRPRFSGRGRPLSRRPEQSNSAPSIATFFARPRFPALLLWLPHPGQEAWAVQAQNGAAEVEARGVGEVGPPNPCENWGSHWRRDLIPSSGAEALMSFVMAGLSAAQRPCQRFISLRLHGSTRPCSKNTLRELAIELLRGVVTSGYPSTCPKLCARPARQRVASSRRCSFRHLGVTHPGSMPLRRSQLSGVACGRGLAYLGTSLPLELPRRVGLLHKKEGATEVPVAPPDLAPWVGRVTNRLLPFRMAVARDGRRLISSRVPKAGRSQP